MDLFKLSLTPLPTFFSLDYTKEVSDIIVAKDTS